MNEKNRNIAIGFTVIVAIVILTIMIIIFAGVPEALTGGTKLIVQAEHTGNLHKGDKIYLRGMRIGEITDVSFTQDNPSMGVTITGIIDDNFCLPKSTKVSVETQGLTSLASLAVWPTDDGSGFYNKGETVVIHNLGESGSSLIPKQVSDAMTDFAKLARSLNELVSGTSEEEASSQPTTDMAATGPASTQPAAKKPADRMKGLAGTVTRVNRTLDSIYAVTGDAKSQQDIKDSIANLKVATEQMKKLMSSADNLSRELITDAEQTGQLLKSFQKTIDSLNEGKGTAGKLLNDPEIYNNLVEVTVQLEGLIKDFRRLSDQWERNGVGIKLK